MIHLSKEYDMIVPFENLNFKMILISIFILAISTKLIRQKVSISHLKRQHNLYYLGKMDVGIGQGKIRIKTRTKGTPYKNQPDRFLSLIYSLDEQYQRINHLKESSCGQMIASNNKKSVSIDGSTIYSSVQQFDLPSVDRQQIWYFFLGDCDFKFQDQKNNLRLYVQVHLTILSSTGSHFSAGQQLVNSYIFLFIFGMVLSSKSMLKLFENYKQLKMIRKSQQIDYPHMIINIAVIINIGGIFWRTIHLIIYSYDGQGLIVFDVFYLILHFLTHFTTQSILLLMAFGWAFTHIKTDYDQLYIPIGKYLQPVALLGMLTLIIGSLTKVMQGDIDVFHTYDSVLGLIIIILHLLIGIGFGVGSILTYNKLKGKMQKFFRIFILAGSFYFLIYPCTVLIAELFINEYNQFKFITVTIEVLQMGTLSLLTFMCVSSKTYNQICYKNGSIFLPNDSKFY